MYRKYRAIFYFVCCFFDNYWKRVNDHSKITYKHFVPNLTLFDFQALECLDCWIRSKQDFGDKLFLWPLKMESEKQIFLHSFLKLGKTTQTSNDIIAGNGRVLKFYFFIVWFYLFKKYIALKKPLQGNGMAAISKTILLFSVTSPSFFLVSWTIYKVSNICHKNLSSYVFSVKY